MASASVSLGLFCLAKSFPRTVISIMDYVYFLAHQLAIMTVIDRVSRIEEDRDETGVSLNNMFKTFTIE